MEHKHQLLDVKTNGTFIFNDALLIDHRQQHLADILNELLSYQNRLEHIIRNGLRHDGRLIGQEKANIVNVLQAVIRDLTALYLKLYDHEHPEEFPGDVLVSLGSEGYLIKGQMDPAETTLNFTIEHWAKSYMEEALAKLVSDFQAAAKDHVFSLAERKQLIRSIATLLVQSIQAFYLMRSGAVFK